MKNPDVLGTALPSRSTRYSGCFRITCARNKGHARATLKEGSTLQGSRHAGRAVRIYMHSHTEPCTAPPGTDSGSFYSCA